MGKILNLKWVGLILLLCINLAFANNPPAFNIFLKKLASVAQQDKISTDTINQYLLTATYLPDVVQHDRYQPEFFMDYKKYVPLFVTKKRIQEGQYFVHNNHLALYRISQQYHVQAQYLVALLGTETNYGENMGNYSAISALATLNYFDNRHKFFESELLSALHILQDKQVPNSKLTGSWAGAMGQCQFMPDLYLQYGVAYQHIGHPDIWHDTADALASTANFLYQIGWNNHETVAIRVSIPKNVSTSQFGRFKVHNLAYWKKLGIKPYKKNCSLPNWEGPLAIITPSKYSKRAYLITKNFNALMRWNSSYLYALSVAKLASSIADSVNFDDSNNPALLPPAPHIVVIHIDPITHIYLIEKTLWKKYLFHFNHPMVTMTGFIDNKQKQQSASPNLLRAEHFSQELLKQK